MIHINCRWSWERLEISNTSICKDSNIFWFLLENTAKICYFLKNVSCLLSQIFIVADSITVGICVFVTCKYVFADLQILILVQVQDISFLAYIRSSFPYFSFYQNKIRHRCCLYCLYLQWYSRRHSPLDTMFHNGFCNSFHLSIFLDLWLQTFS